MSTELTCFILGIPASLIWWTGMKKGLMVGPNARRVLKDFDPVVFWILAAWWGMIAIGLLVAPILSWLGLRS